MIHDENHNDQTCCGEDESPSIPVRWSTDVDEKLELTDASEKAACKFSNQHQRRRHSEVVEPLLEAADDIRVDDDSVTLSYAPDVEVLRALVAFVDVERTCCPFFGFELRVEPQEGPMRLTIETPPDFDNDRFTEVIG